MKNEIETGHCPTVLLSDEPASQDSFDAPEKPGAHAKVAQALSDLVEHSDGGKAVALEGGWGSGKSTVISIFHHLLNQPGRKQKSCISTFDAWAHEGDPLRRIYLESVLSDLMQKGWIDSEVWTKRVDEISNRRRVTRTKRISTTTRLGAAFAVSLLLLPIGSIFMNEAVRHGLTVNGENGVSWNFLFGAVIFLPLAVLFGNALRLCLTKPRFSIRRITSAESWAFIKANAEEVIESETTETPNPTSLEFESHFSDAVKEALGADVYRRLVLVIDNLDRVDPRHALQIWSTLQTFLQHRQTIQRSWFRQLWIVVPFDPIGLRRLWDGDSSARALNVDLQMVAQSAGKDVSASFFEKSFQTRLIVPPLVLSDWRAHFFDLLGEALPHHKEDRHKIYLVYDQVELKGAKLPTPRQLKVFVNQLGSMHRQWEHQFPIEHIAYFTLVYQSTTQVVSDLRIGRLPTEDAVRLLGRSLGANLAGMAFGVSAERGRELLLERPILEALEGGNVNVLGEIRSSHPEGFWLVLEGCARRFFGMHGGTLAKIAKTIQESDVVRQKSRPEADTVRSCLLEAANSTGADQWGMFDETLVSGLSSLCVIADDEQFSHARYMQIREWFRMEAAKANLISAGVSTVSQILPFLRKLKELDHLNSPKKKAIALPFGPELWVSACGKLFEEDPGGEYWGYFASSERADTLVGHLTECVSNGTFNRERCVAAEISYRQKNEVSWDGFVSAISGRFRPNSRVSDSEAFSLLRSLRRLRDSGSVAAKDAVQMFVSSGHCMHHFHQIGGNTDSEAKGEFLYVYLSLHPDGGLHANVGNGASGHRRMEELLLRGDEAVARHISSICRESQDGWKWPVACAVAQKDCRRLVAEIISEVIVDLPGSCEPTEMLNNWSHFYKACKAIERESLFHDLVRRLVEASDVAEGMKRMEGGFSLRHGPLYASVLSRKSDQGLRVMEWIANEMNGLESSVWDEEFSDPGDGVELILKLLEQGSSLQLDIPFVDSVVSHARSVAREEAIPRSELFGRWPKLLEGVSKRLRGDIGKKLLTDRIRDSREISEEYLELYGPWLLSPAHIASTDAFSLLFGKWVKDGGPHFALVWLRDSLNGNPEIWKMSRSTSAGEEFLARLKRKPRDGTDEETQVVLSDLLAIVEDG